MNDLAKYKIRGFVYKFISASLMGGIGAFARYINAPGDFISFGRQLTGFIALSLMFCFMPGMWKKVRGFRFSPAILLTGINLGLLSGLYVISTQYTTLANASLLIYTGPLFSTTLAAVFLKEKVNVQRFLCLLSVAVGMLFVVGIITPNGLTLDLAPEYATGNLIAFASGVAYGLYLFFSRYRLDADSGVRSWYQFGVAAVTILLLMVGDSWVNNGLKYTVKVNGVTQFTADGRVDVEPWNIFTMDAQSWVVWISAAVISGFIAFHLLTYASKMLTAAELASISYQEVVMASALGIFMFGEHMDTFQWIGAVMIVVGGFSQIFFTTKESNAQGDEAQVPNGAEVSADARGA